MGVPMAANLLKAGTRLKVWNRTPGPVRQLAALGAQAATSAREAGEGVDVLISMLSDDAATRAVLFDEEALAGLPPGAIHINMATVSVAFAVELQRQHRERGIVYVAAPVMGRVQVAEAGQLNILAAGDAAALGTVQPLFDAMGQKTWHVGERPEQANAVKLAVNFMIASAIGTMSEAMVFLENSGISKDDFLDLIGSTLFASPVYKGYGAAIAQGRFEPAGFKLALAMKDMGLLLEAAAQVKVPMSLASVLRDQHLEAIAHGNGHLDWAALSCVAARHAAPH